MNVIVILGVIVIIGVVAYFSKLDFIRPSKTSPTIAKPTIASPAIAKPTIASPTIAKPTIAKPTLAKPTIVKPTIASPTKEQTRITKEALKENKQHIIDHYLPYLSTLYLKKQQLTYVDEYGDTIETDWNNELIWFIKNKMDMAYEAVSDKANFRFDREVSLDGYKNNFRTDIRNFIEEDIITHIIYMIETAIIDYNTESFKEVEEEYNLEDPILFEKSVAKNFINYGWIAKETKRTGDQGADVIAEKDRFKIIVQCKLYSHTIGNKAVQEAFAAQKYYNGDLSLVVSNAGFTKSAQQLAESNDVVLLHYTNLNSFLEKIQSS